MERKIIYVVDDDDAVRESALMFLEAKGFGVRAFRSGTAFIEETGGEGADCLLLDVHMPGLNGAELLEILRKSGVRTPAVVLTGRFDPGMAARLSKAGASTILEKPVDGVALLGAINSAIHPRD